MKLNRRHAPKALISLVPMIDVMMILLVFFMVTSTYLNLDMIPVIKPASNGGAPAGAERASLMIRISADGSFMARGTSLSRDDLRVLLTQTAQSAPETRLFLLPSGAAPLQSTVALMDLAAQSGLSDLRILRLEARP